MEHRINELFEYNGIKLRVVEDVNADRIKTCGGCYFFGNFACLRCRNSIGECSKHYRQDGMSVVFRKEKTP